MNYFVNNIKFLRKLTGKNQIDFGKLFDKSGSTVANWEIGRRSPIVADTVQIARFFHLNVDELLFSNLAVRPDLLTYGEDEAALLDAFKQLNSIDRKTIIAVAKGMVK